MFSLLFKYTTFFAQSNFALKINIVNEHRWHSALFQNLIELQVAAFDKVFTIFGSRQEIAKKSIWWLLEKKKWKIWYFGIEKKNYFKNGTSIEFNPVMPNVSIW